MDDDGILKITWMVMVVITISLWAAIVFLKCGKKKQFCCGNKRMHKKKEELACTALQN